MAYKERADVERDIGNGRMITLPPEILNDSELFEVEEELGELEALPAAGMDSSVLKRKLGLSIRIEEYKSGRN